MRPSQLLSIALLSSTISAWSLQDSLADSKAIQGIENLFRRTDSTTDNANAPTSTESQAKSSATTNSDSTNSDDSSTDSSASTATDDSSASTTDGSSASTTDSSDSTASSSGSKKTSGSSGSSGTAKTTAKATSGKSSSTTVSENTSSYNASVGYGGLSMITPNPASSSSYYKVGNYITFAWNMTSLSITPTAIDILASCSANAQMYTIALNQTVNGSTGAVTWDTGEYQATGTVPLLTETYTLVIHDAARDVTATAPYGGFAAFSAFRFAMYTKQAYTGLSDGWKCVTCNGAMSQAERQTLSVVFGMATLTILSFTYFAGSFGVF